MWEWNDKGQISELFEKLQIGDQIRFQFVLEVNRITITIFDNLELHLESCCVENDTAMKPKWYIFRLQCVR